MNIKKKVEGILQQKFAEQEYQDLFLVEVKYHASQNKLLVFVDADAGLSLDRCKRLSRFLEEYLDSSLVLNDNYTLEVSSPGLDRPLLTKRQFKKNIGRDIEITTEENIKYLGTMMEVTDEGVMLKRVVKKKEELVELSFEDITKALIQIKF